METIYRRLSALRLFVFGFLVATSAHAQTPTAFTYQGQLTDAGSPANGDYDIRFELLNDATGTPDGNTIISFGVDTLTNVAVTDGIFTTEIDFGQSPWGTGADAFFIEVAVRESGSSDPFTVLSPRQAVTAAPLATFALGVSATTIFGQVDDGNLPDTFSSARTFSSPSNIFFGDGSNLTSLDASELIGEVPAAALPTIPVSSLGNAWTINGNSGTTGGVNFLGTLDSVPLELRTNNTSGLRIIPHGGSLVSLIGGDAANSTASAGTTIGGGGSAISPQAVGSSSNSTTISGGVGNSVGSGSSESTIGGGSANSIQDNATRSSISGGRANTIGDNADNSSIGGGIANTIVTDAASSTIAGGASNTINASAAGGTISGGSSNVIAAEVFSATIGGGSGNSAGGESGGFPTGVGATVSGGQDNTATGNRAVVSGGLDNSATGTGAVVAGGSNNNASGLFGAVSGGTDNSAAGSFSTVPGGELNAAFFSHSFAAGFRAKANHQGAFVWSDNLDDSDFASAVAGEFAVRARGGVRFVTNGSGLSLDSSQHYLSANATTGRFGDANGFDFNPNITTTGLIIEQGANESSGIHFDGDTVSIWSPGDNNRLVSFYDEDGMVEKAYISGDGSFASVANISAGLNVIADVDVTAGRNLVATEGLIFTEEGLADSARITFFDNFKYIEASEENGAIRFQASLFGFNRFPSISGNAATLQLNGSASKTTAGSWLAHSDRRIKKEIQTIDGPTALETLAQVRPVSFHYTEDYSSKHSGIESHEYINVIAQEFAEVFPDWVTDSGEVLEGEATPLLQVDTYPLTLYSVAAIQELKSKIETQEATIDSLEKANQALIDRIEALEHLVLGQLNDPNN